MGGQWYFSESSPHAEELVPSQDPPTNFTRAKGRSQPVGRRGPSCVGPAGMAWGCSASESKGLRGGGQGTGQSRLS